MEARKKVFKKGLLIFIIILFFPFGWAAAEDTIKLGCMEPLSGDFKDVGERYLEGVEYAVKEINENGGLLGKKVEVVAIDSEVKPAVAMRKATRELQKNNVRFFCGGTGSSVGAAMSEFAERQNGIFFSYGMDAASMTGEKCNRHFFRPGGSTDGRSFALAQALAKTDHKRVAMIAQDYSFGQEAVAAFKKKIKELRPDIELVAEIYHPIGTKDFAPYISQIVSAKPDAIFTSNWGNDLTLLIRQGGSMGMEGQLFCYYINDPVLLQSVDADSVLGSVGAEIYMLTIPTAKNEAFKEKFKAEKGYYPSWLRGKAYTATLFWAEALKKAGSTDPEAVIEAWEGLAFDGPAGKWYMRACDHQGQVPYWVDEIVKDSPYFDHAYIAGPAKEIPAGDVAVPCEETGCNM